MKTLNLLFLLITFLFALSTPISHGGNGGFTLDLIRRDSPLSPLYNPTEDRLNRIKNAFARSISRASSLSKKTSTASRSSSKIEADVYGIPGEYIMKISIGTPPVETLGIADTGSDLTWVQCKPCRECYKQVGTPIFTPSSSATYRALTCQTKACQALGDSPNSCSKKNTCLYEMRYGDQSYTMGDLAVETFWFGTTAKTNVVFGCGHENKGTFNETTSGIIGLGGGPLSLTNQFKDIQGKFSYCLIPVFSDDSRNSTSKINFGSQAIVSGVGVVSTPLVEKEPSTYYYLTLESVSVGNNNLPYKKPSSSKAELEEGNIIIDSGTTLTFLSGDFFNDLSSALTEAIGGRTVEDPQGLFSLCFKNLRPERIPTITFHFTGANVELPPTNTFLEVQEGISCLSMTPADDLAIFGNLAQGNFLIGYDLVNKKLSFKSTDCAKQ